MCRESVGECVYEILGYCLMFEFIIKFQYVTDYKGLVQVDV